MKIRLFFVLSTIAFLSSCSNDEYIETPINQRPLYEHPYYVDKIKGDADKTLIPKIIELELAIDNIQGLETNKEDYRLIGMTSTYLPYTDTYVDIEGDTLFTKDDYFWEVNYIFDETKTWGVDIDPTVVSTNEEYKKIHKIDSVTQVVEFFDQRMFHEWDLRKYPFDKQSLRFVVRSLKDTTFSRFRESSMYPPSFSINNDLKDGFKIEQINFKEEFFTSSFFDPVLEEYSVLSEGVFEIGISRTGSWLFIKLFFGGVLALVISWLVFLIPLRDFSSRIELSIGAVFAAVGNKYFVDAAIDSQVLTVADLFNNIIIFMVVLNVGLIIMKRNPSFKNKLINNTRTVSRISIYTALVLFSLLTIYTIS